MSEALSVAKKHEHEAERVVLGPSEHVARSVSLLDMLVSSRSLAHLEGRKAVEPAFIEQLRTVLLSTATFGASRIPAALRAAREGKWGEFGEQVMEMGLSFADSRELYELVFEHVPRLAGALEAGSTIAVIANFVGPLSMMAGCTMAWVHAIEQGRQAYARERYAMQFATTVVYALVYNEPVGSFTDDAIGVVARTHGRTDAYAVLRGISAEQVAAYRTVLLADAGSVSNLRAAIIDRIRELAGVEGVVTHRALSSEAHR